MSSRLRQTRLVLFFTRGIGLTDWERGGMLEREVALWRALRPHLGGITFVTYGGPEDLAFAPRLEGIDIVCNRWGLSPRNYLRQLAWFPPAALRGGTLFRSNQVNGAEVGLDLAQRWGVPFVARCGYLYAYTTRQRHGAGTPQARAAAALEGEVFRGGRRAVVTTAAMAHQLTRDYGVAPERIRVIPNYVETDLFRPRPEVTPGPRRLVFVGRLAAEKNLLALLQGVAGLGVELWLVGDGPMRFRLEEEARSQGVAARWCGTLPHRELPAILTGGALFVLPSRYEGHPKALLEAMACGRAVLGGDSPGVRELIRHGETGWLAGLEPEALGGAVRLLLADQALRERLGGAARGFVVENFSLELTVERELALLEEVAGEGAP